jgi:serine/threonine-protein kinase RsbW
VTGDVRLAVTEACTNVVRHAYRHEGGSIDVAVHAQERALDVTVADTGRGIEPSPDTSGPGLGLALIAALADSLEVERSAGAGSRLTMSFPRSRATAAIGFA